jgi:RND superfamily putative drug exporter
MKLFPSKKPTLPPTWLRILLPTALIIVWLALAGMGGTYFGKLSEVSKLDLASFLPNSSEATKVNDQLEHFSKESDKALPGVIVFEAKDNEKLSGDDRARIENVRDELAKSSYIKGELPPVTNSKDEKAALLIVPLDSDTDMKITVPAINTLIDKQDIKATHHVTGPAGFSADLGDAFSGIDGLLLGVALAVVLVILLIVYRSPILPFVVLATSLLALAASVLLVYNLANAGIVQLNGQTQGILFILVIGAATDYSLLYVARYREELLRHEKTWHASVRALKATIEPVMASGGTVIVGLLCLLLSDLESNKALGPIGSIGILFAIASALTLLPALLLLVGRKAFWPLIPRYSAKKQKDDEAGHGLWQKVAGFVQKRPRTIWLSTVALLIIGCVGILQLKADGASQADMVLGDSSARKGQALLEKHFAGGLGTPVQVVVPKDKQVKAVELLERSKHIDGVTIAATNAESGQVPVGTQEQEIRKKIADGVLKQMQSQQEMAANLPQPPEGAPMPGSPLLRTGGQVTLGSEELDKIVDQAYPFSDAKFITHNNTVLLSATLTVSSESDKAKDVVRELRKELHKLDESILVGGNTATQIDSNTAALHDRAIIIPTILVAITIILMLLLRSVLAPLFLLLTTVLSFGTAIGVAALLFNHVWQFPGADPSVILYGFVFLVALGIDYNIFLMTRVREESLLHGTRKGVLKGLVVTGGVITSAGIVLAATFAALAVIPILFLAQLAFIVAFGVLLDTIIVRSLLVPSFILDVGSRIWWPSKKLTRKE